MRTDRRHGMLAAAALVAAELVFAACGGSDEEVARRQADVAERGADVMPFDLEATTHSFEPTDDGLVQTVVADDPEDDAQRRLVRQHLRDEADRFRQGDYDDPAAIHGDDMPGLADLEAGAGSITIDYADVPAGARLTFTTADTSLVDALHRWAEAQTMDHGAHAES